MLNSTKKKIIALTMIAIFLAGGYLGLNFKKSKISIPTPIEYVTDGLIPKPEEVKGLLDNISNDIYKTIAMHQEESSIDTKVDTYLSLVQNVQSIEEVERYTEGLRDLAFLCTLDPTSEKAQKGFRKVYDLMTQFKVNRQAIGDFYYRDFSTDAKDNFEVVFVDVLYMGLHGAPLDKLKLKQDVEDWKNNVDTIIKTFKPRGNN